MKFNFYRRSLSLFLSGTFFLMLPGCSNRKVDSSEIESNVFVLDDNCNYSDTSILTSSTSNTSSATFSTTSESVSTCVAYNDYDLFVLDYFKGIGDNIKNSVDTDLLLEQGKKYFIFCVDFLFYDSEINGIKFDDLSIMAKQQLLNDILTIDLLICSKFPNYKETISKNSASAYNKAFQIIKDGSNNIKDFSKEKLGEENYERILESKDMFVQKTIDDFNEFTDILDQGKQYVKEWYEELR